MNIWTNPITDRTQADVDEVKRLYLLGYSQMTDSERVAWLEGMKGALNRSDLERILNNIQILSDVLELELEIAEIPSIPDRAFFENILDNVSAIREVGIIYHDSPNVPDAPLNEYNKINDVEQILSDVYTILLNNFYYYTGEIYAGDTIGLLL